MTRHATVRAAGLMAVVAAVAVSCTVPAPFTYPLSLSAARDATAEVQQLAGTTPMSSPAQLATAIAATMSGVKPGCEVFVVARVMWVAGGQPAQAAIESRGACDDSIGGGWYELTIVPDAQLGWVVSAATRQDVCRRGLSGTICV